MADRETIVLGGGLSGLAVAHYLGDDTLVLEAEDRPGGLCRSFEKGGFTYDIGGHILFSRSQGVLDELVSWLGDNVDTRERKGFIWYRDRLVKYPFENGLAALDKEELFEILLTYLNRPDMTPTNLEEWCHARFGRGLAEKYLAPYNRKIWKRDLKQMSLHWVDRVPSPPTEDVVKSALGIETEGYQFQYNYYYPKRGGIESLIHGLVGRVGDVETGFRARSVRRQGGVWEVSDGERTVTCERLVSTIPLVDLIACLDDVPDAVRDAAAGLQYNSLILVMAGLNHTGLADITGIYFPDAHIAPHRVCYGTYSAPANAPEGHSVLVAEITAPPGAPMLDESDAVLVERVVSDVKDVCGFSPDDVVESAVQRVRYAYPVYDLAYTHNTQTLYDYLDAQGIHFTGRFGAWRYVNTDVCVHMARGLADALRKGEKPVRDWEHL